VTDQFCGERAGGIEVPGHLWHVTARKEHVPPKGLKKGAEAAMAAHGKDGK
jgi:hypothetical protein